MTELYNSIAVLLLSLYAIVEFSRIFLQGALGLCNRFKLPQFLVGIFIVSIGTSAPELSINIFASLKSEGNIIVSNVIGSNIINIALGLGIAEIISRNYKIDNSYLLVVLFGFIVTIALFLNTIIADSDGYSNLSRILGSIFIIIFIAYIYISIKHLGMKDEENDIQAPRNLGIQIFFLVAGAIAMTVSADLAVQNAVVVADAAGLPKALIGATIIAAGGSLPEIATCIRAALNGFPKIALGNVVGSQIFNLLGVLGVAAVVNPFQYSSSLIADWTILLLITFVLIVGLTVTAIRKVLGPLLVGSYGLYIIYLIWMKTEFL